VVGQSYLERAPAAALGRRVACVWVQRVAPGAGTYEHRTVPNASVELVCDTASGAVTVVGPQRAARVERLAAGSTIVGLRLAPGAAPAVLGPNAAELRDLHVELADLWGRSAAELRGRIAEAPTAGAAARLLEEAIAAREPGDADPVVAAAVQRLAPWGGREVRDVAAELFVSPRNLRRRCVAAVGFGPKELQRVLRFQGFIALSYGHGYAADLARLSATAGYADQAHLTRECRRLTGLSPRLFLRETAAGCGASHDHRVSFARLAASFKTGGGRRA
jgi:AraC-like DNA-binding protein